VSVFAAIQPPGAATQPHADALVALSAEVTAGLRIGGRERWHVTVGFYGDRPDTATIERRLAWLAVRTPPMRVALSGAGTFGQGLLWAGIAGDTAALQALMRAADDPGTRTPRPHLTLGRARDPGTDLTPIVGLLAGIRGPAWSASELVLIRSLQGPPRHEVIARWRLGQG
jgi:2'-5' RNA ligase